MKYPYKNKKYRPFELQKFGAAWASACFIGKTHERREKNYVNSILCWLCPPPWTAKKVQIEVDRVNRLLDDNSLLNCGEADGPPPYPKRTTVGVSKGKLPKPSSPSPAGSSKSTTAKAATSGFENWPRGRDR